MNKYLTTIGIDYGATKIYVDKKQVDKWVDMIDLCLYRWIYRKIDRYKDGQIEKWIDRKMDRKIDRQKDRLIKIYPLLID